MIIKIMRLIQVPIVLCILVLLFMICWDLSRYLDAVAEEKVFEVDMMINSNYEIN